MDQEHLQEQQSSPERVMVTAGPRGLRLDTLEAVWRYSQYVAKSGLMKTYKTPEQCFVAICFAMELGLPPMQAFTCVMVVGGRPSLYGDGMLAVVSRSPLLEDIVETIEGGGAAMVATCRVKRRGRSEVVARFSWTDAVLAGLTHSELYKKHPGRMLKHRARSFALRDSFPDLLNGVLEYEEAKEAAGWVDGAEQTHDDLEALLVSDVVPVSSGSIHHRLPDGSIEEEPLPPAKLSAPEGIPLNEEGKPIITTLFAKAKEYE